MALDESILFHEDFKQSTDMESLGKISNSTNLVKRKYARDLNWYSLGNEDEVFEADSIYTDPNADAEVTFKDGSKLFIEPATLLTITRKNNQSLIDIKKGSISSKLSKGNKLQIKSGESGQTQEVQGDNSQIQFNVGESGKDTKLTVLSGNIKIKSGAKKEQTIEKNQIATLSEEGELKDIEKIYINLLSPNNNKISWMGPLDKGQEFTWTIEGQDDPSQSFEIEVSLDQNFTKILKKQITTNKKILLEGLPKNKALYWHIISKTDTKTNKSPFFRFKILEEIPPTLIFPKDASTLTFNEDTLKDKEDGVEVNLRWSDSLPSSSYQILLSKDDQFKNVIVKEISDTKSFRTIKLKAGEYFWKIKVNDKESRPLGSWSGVSTFSLQKKTSDSKDLLKMLSSQKLGAPIEVSSSEQIEVVDEKSPTGEILSKTKKAYSLLQWKSVEGAEKYQIEVSKSEEMKPQDTVKKMTLNSRPEFIFKTDRSGKYFWRVSALDKKGKEGLPSEVRSVLIKEKEKILIIPTPEIISPLSKEEDIYNVGELIKLEWKSLNNISSYEIEVSSTEDFSQIKRKEKTNNNYLSEKVEKSGPSYWRVRAYSEDGKQAGPYSKLGSYSGKISLRAPEIITKTSSFPHDSDNYIEWKPLKEASAYYIQFSKNSNFSNPFEKKISSSQSKIKIPYSERGEYYFKMAMITEDKKNGPFSPLKRFLITKKLDAPKIIFAKKVDPPYFVWKRESGVKEYELYFVSTSTAKVLNKTINSNHYNLENFPKGKFQWKIRAIDEDGTPGEYTSLQDFEVRNPGQVAICQKKTDSESFKDFNLEKISIDDETGCVLIRK